MKTGKWMSIMLAALLLAAVLSGCVQPPESQATPAPEAPAQAEPAPAAPAEGDQAEAPAAEEGKNLSGLLRVAWAGMPLDDGINPLSGETYRGFSRMMDEEFIPMFPDVQLELTTVPWTDYETKLRSMLMAEQVDIVGAGGSENMFYDQGLVMPLDDFIANDPTFKPEERFVSAAWEGCVFNQRPDGTRYALPYVLGRRMPIYDKKLFDDWGVEYLSEHPTPDEVLEKAAKMTGTNPVTGEENFGLWFEGNNLANSLFTTLCIYYDAPGFSGSTADGFKNVSIELNAPGVVKALEFYTEAVKYCSPAIVNNQGNERMGKEDNNVAIYLENNGSVIMSDYRVSGGTDTSMIERFVPTLNFGPNGEGWVACDNVIIAKSAQNLDLCWEAMKFFTSETFYEFLYTVENLPPSLNADFVDPNDIYTKMALRIAQHGSVNIHDSLPELHALEVLPCITGFVSDAVNGLNPDPKATLDALQERAVKWQNGLQ